MIDVSIVLFVWMLRIFRNNHIIIQRLLFTYLEETAAVAQWARAFASQAEGWVPVFESKISLEWDEKPQTNKHT